MITRELAHCSLGAISHVGLAIGPNLRAVRKQRSFANHTCRIHMIRTSHIRPNLERLAASSPPGADTENKQAALTASQLRRLITRAVSKGGMCSERV